MKEYLDSDNCEEITKRRIADEAAKRCGGMDASDNDITEFSLCGTQLGAGDYPEIKPVSTSSAPAGQGIVTQAAAKLTTKLYSTLVNLGFLSKDSQLVKTESLEAGQNKSLKNHR